MVFKHKKQPFIDDELYQFGYKHSRQVSCSSQLASYLGIPPYGSIPEESHTLDEEVEEVYNQFQGEERPAGDPITELSVNTEQSFGSRRGSNYSENDPENFSSLSWVTCSTDEDVVRSMHSKRPPITDEPHHLANKRARQVDYSCQPVSFELLPFNAVSEKPPNSVALGKELENSEEIRSEMPIRVSLSPRFIENDNQASNPIQLEEIYPSFFDYFPRKHVAVGPDHQADIPAWSPWGIKSLSGELDHSVGVHLMTDKDNSEKFMGTCIITMPDVDSVASDEAIVGVGRSDCNYPDEGSSRCVRQHIMEARGKLEKTLGRGKFLELGFCDMGEYVAQNWTEEEEQAFHGVVFANPASLGKNFWDHLPQVFPSRSIKDLISYYFNVFMLRKRAGQNRSDPLNVDSDNDEWQESDDGDFAAEDYEEDSVVESPVDQDDIYHSDGHEEDDFHEELHEEDEDGDACDDCAASVEDHDQELYDVSKGHTNPKSSFISAVQLSKNLQHAEEDFDVQDDSCTSHEGQHCGTDCSRGHVVAEYTNLEKDHKRLHVEYRSLGNVMDPGYIASPSDPKTWDIGYFLGQEKGPELLSTRHVIEEVFGKGSWDKEARNGQGFC